MQSLCVFSVHWIFSWSVSASREHSIFSHIGCSSVPMHSSECQLYFSQMRYLWRRSIEAQLSYCTVLEKYSMHNKQIYYTHLTIMALGITFHSHACNSTRFWLVKVLTHALEYLPMLCANSCS